MAALLKMARFAGSGNLIFASFVLFGVTMLVIAGQFAMVGKAEDRILGSVELLPPGQRAVVWDPPSTANNYTLTFSISIWEEGNKSLDGAGSRIMDFGILVVEENPKGRSKISVEPYRPDPLTGKDYRIPIDFVRLIGNNATVIYGEQWSGASGRYEIPDRIAQTYGVDGEGNITLTDEKHAYVSGIITFNNWEPNKYYVIIWCVDEYGNARVVPYCIDGNSDSGDTYADWKVSSGNIRGYSDPVEDWENYFYTIGEEPYVPYIGTWAEYQRCVVLYFAPRTYLRLGGETLDGADTYWGYFTLRLEIFWVGEAEADGVVLRFFVERAPHGIDGYVYSLSFIALFAALPIYCPRLARERG